MSHLILSLVLILTPAFAQASGRTELAKIEILIQKVERMNAVMIRNGRQHSPRDAADHLRRKLRVALRSIHSSEINAREFVLKVASKSSMTGQPYLVRFPNGRTMLARDWLLARLAEIN